MEELELFELGLLELEELNPTLLMLDVLEILEVLEVLDELDVELELSLSANCTWNNRLPNPLYPMVYTRNPAVCVMLSPMNVKVCSLRPPTSQTKDPPTLPTM